MISRKKSTSQRKNSDYHESEPPQWIPDDHYLLPEHSTTPPRHTPHPEPDIIVLGCSNTYGSGLPAHHAWPVRLAEHLGVKINNLSYPGCDIGLQIHALYKHMREYGKPKHILCLWPELQRWHTVIWMTEDNPYIGSSGPFQEPNGYSATVGLAWDSRNNFYSIGKIPYLHIPHPESDHKPKPYRLWPEQAIRENLTHMAHLEDICKLMGINLIQLSWNQGTNTTMSKIFDSYRAPRYSNKPFSQHVQQIDTRFIPDEECDRHTPSDHPEVWDIADDNLHPGSHTQIHIAEHFADCLKQEPRIRIN